jgi:hypothetical protein
MRTISQTRSNWFSLLMILLKLWPNPDSPFRACANSVGDVRRQRLRLCLPTGARAGALGGFAEKVYPQRLSLGITSLQLQDKKSNGGEGGINIHRLRFAINDGKFLL